MVRLSYEIGQNADVVRGGILIVLGHQHEHMVRDAVSDLAGDSQ